MTRLREELFRCSDGACSIIVERLSLGEIGVRTERNDFLPGRATGIILTDEQCEALIAALTAGVR